MNKKEKLEKACGQGYLQIEISNNLQSKRQCERAHIGSPSQINFNR